MCIIIYFLFKGHGEKGIETLVCLSFRIELSIFGKNIWG